MTARILDGKKIADAKLQALASGIQTREVAPGLAVILVGDDPASHIYVSHKHRACESIGIRSTIYHRPADITNNALQDLIDTLNHDDAVHGILLQLPLPSHINANQVLELIDPQKDVDGFHPYNLGRLAQGSPLLRPCTPYGVMQLLKAYDINVRGSLAVVVGASNIVGKPMALELLLAQATPVICHRATQHLDEIVREADILLSATGSHHVIDSAWIKPGAVVVDIGFSRLPNGNICGDIDFESACERASFITPVPGGVGPMTVATLMENTVLAADLR
jgi:methylenetetrahydrofolate dehydrogenase (NADP+)/methenyltetrahydrofolate cyclohydrolase